MSEIDNPNDHRIIGKQMDLFHIQEEGKGMVFWHPKGWTLYRLLESYIRGKLDRAGYVEVNTPSLMDRKLWEKSGHWEKFQKNMFVCETAEEESLALKPMNCPSHIQIFNVGIKSYRDLPLRMAEFGSCHRYESSGGLYGIMRVRAFKQDDAHIFCRENQIVAETKAFIELLQDVYRDLGVTLGSVKLALRPDVRAGTDEMWDKAESQLEAAALAAGVVAEKVPNDGAFYGPKLEFHLKDSLGRSWQCGTIQLDFVLPKRLDASYINEAGEKEVPVMLHRAILGTFERFLGIYIEHCEGKFPPWLAPVQAVVCPIVSECDEYAEGFKQYLQQDNQFGRPLRVESDLRNEKIGMKIREHTLQKVPFLVIIGKKEVESNQVTIRFRGEEGQLTCDWELAKVRLDAFSRIHSGWAG